MSLAFVSRDPQQFMQMRLSTKAVFAVAGRQLSAFLPEWARPPAFSVRGARGRPPHPLPSVRVAPFVSGVCSTRWRGRAARGGEAGQPAWRRPGAAASAGRRGVFAVPVVPALASGISWCPTGKSSCAGKLMAPTRTFCMKYA